ncbi:hypothetical protein N7468_009798 [Penicillium chermesinum]|uniref:Acyltransferase 3 domain-containing protein n=1 Tax=Penicillium chermesinum TaxID=63820 RepID=A0A9W9NBH4_9EURO|nr:uncharacterized protein N7468_009798 [Penicillium chermesinum]KAJ5216790.1 hypothetical protein N7468_009798 [Penicillium chermesinum]
MFAWSGGSAKYLRRYVLSRAERRLRVESNLSAPVACAGPDDDQWTIPRLFPDDNAGLMPWSRTIEYLTCFIIPEGAEVNRFVVTIGTTIFVFGVFFSADARRLLSHPIMNFLGRISFPIYLIHNTLIRTVLTWLLYRHSAYSKGLDNVDHEGNPVFLDRGGCLTFIVAIPLFYIILIYLAHMWTVHVDPRCEKAVSWIKRLVFGEDESERLKEGTLDGLLKF